MANLRTVDLGGYTLRTWRASSDEGGRRIEYEIVSAAGELVRRGGLRWPSERIASECVGRKKKSRAIDSDASLRAILKLAGELKRESNLPGYDHEEVSDVLKRFYSDYAARLHFFVTADRPFANLDGWKEA
jgi:hypothetical protein